MRQASIMKEHTGMRKGISLVEMLIAIVLFGVIATASYVYYKNYYDTAFAAKKLAISVVVDQASQLSNTYDMYTIEKGVTPTTIQAIVDERFLIETPVSQPSITATGWELVVNKEVNGTTATNDIVFSMPIDGTANTADRLDYCNILNNKANPAWSVLAATSADGDQNTSAEHYDGGVLSATSQLEYFHCDRTAADTYNLVFVKTVIQL